MFKGFVEIPGLFLTLQQADHFITWIRSKTSALGLLKDTTGLVVIRPVETRWTSRCLAYRRLLDVHEGLKVVFAGDHYRLPQDRVIFQGDSKAIARANAMADIVNNGLFWQNLTK